MKITWNGHVTGVICWQLAPHGSEEFPPGSHGYFYFHRYPDNSLFALEIRFRCVQNPDTEPSDAFKNGHDLLLGNGVTWRISMAKLVLEKFTAFRLALIHDGLVQSSVFDQFHTLLDGIRLNLTRPVIFGPRYPFTIQLHRKKRTATVIGDASVEMLCFSTEFFTPFNERGNPRTSGKQISNIPHGFATN